MRGLYFTIISRISLFLSVFLVLLGCNYSIKKGQSGGDLNPLGKTDGSTPISFSLIQKSILYTCKDCHAGVNQPYLNNLEDYKAHRDQILLQVNENKMPQVKKGYAPLSDCQKGVLKKWIDLGLPEESTETFSSVPECQATTGQPPLPPSPDLTPIELLPLNFDNLFTRIIQPKCISCHDSDGDAYLYPFYPYAMILDEDMGSGSDWKAPGVKSKVIRFVTKADDDENLMPPVDSKIERLTPQEIDYIIRWIDAGKPEK